MYKMILSFVGFAFSVVATYASADLIEDFGVIPAPGAGTTQTVRFNNAHDAVEAGSFFIDSYTFTLEQDAIVELAVEDIDNSPLLDIFNLQTRLSEENGSVLFEGFGDTTQSGGLTLLTGNYVIEILGNVTGTSNIGAYAGTVTVSAVPIPAAGLLFFSGIAVLSIAHSKHATT